MNNYDIYPFTIIFFLNFKIYFTILIKILIVNVNFIISIDREFNTYLWKFLLKLLPCRIVQ